LSVFGCKGDALDGLIGGGGFSGFEAAGVRGGPGGHKSRAGDEDCGRVRVAQGHLSPDELLLQDVAEDLPDVLVRALYGLNMHTSFSNGFEGLSADDIGGGRRSPRRRSIVPAVRMICS